MRVDEIERFYFHLQNAINQETSHRIRVRLLLDYFKRLPHDLNSQLLLHYITIPLQWLYESLQNFVLSELSVPVLEEILDILQKYPSPEGRQTLVSDRKSHVREWLAKKWIWVGEVEKGIHVLFPETQEVEEVEISDRSHPLQRAKDYRNRIPDSTAMNWLSQFVADWDSLLTHSARDSLPILGIDLRGDGGVPENPTGCLLDIVIHTNQKRHGRLGVRIVPPPPEGDQIHVAATNALAAAIKSSGLHIYSGEWEIRPVDPNSELSQSSLGAAMAVLLLNQLLHDHLQPHRKFLQTSSVTAEIDQDGRLRPVNEKFIHEKVERAYFSPLENIFVAREQGRQFREEVDKWQQQFPRKSLEIIECQSISELMYDPRFAQVTRTQFTIWMLDRLLERKMIAGSVLFGFFAAGLYLIMQLLPPMYNPFINHIPDHLDSNISYPYISVYNKNNQWLWSFDVENKRFYKKSKPTESTHYVTDSRSRSQIGDVDGDGYPEIFFMLNNPGNTIPGSLMRVSWHGELEVTAPIPIPANCPSPPPATITWTARDLLLVDWDNSGIAKIYVTINRRDGHQIFGIEEVGPDLKTIAGVLWKNEWWIPVRPVKNAHSTSLMCGSRTADGGAPLLAIFHKRIPFGIWPPADTSGMQIYRFPIDPLLKEIGASGFVNGIDVNEHAPIRVTNGCLEMEPYWRLCSYSFDFSGRFLRLDHSGSQWIRHQKLALSYSLHDEQTIQQYRQYMGHLEIWTGTVWQSLDSTEVLPESAYYFR